MNIDVSFNYNGVHYHADIKDAALGYMPCGKQNTIQIRVRKSTTIDICHCCGKNPKNWEHYDVVDFDNFKFGDSDIPGCQTLTITSLTSATFR